jgi:hypothetical protein
MKASEWIQMIWDTVPEAHDIFDDREGVTIRDKNGVRLLYIKPKALKFEEKDAILRATRPSETERVPVIVGDVGRMRIEMRPGCHICASEAVAYRNFLGYELAGGTLSPRLEAGMDVVAVHFKKGKLI